jgi:hypothetical protein
MVCVASSERGGSQLHIVSWLCGGGEREPSRQPMFLQDQIANCILRRRAVAAAGGAWEGGSSSSAQGHGHKQANASISAQFNWQTHQLNRPRLQRWRSERSGTGGARARGRWDWAALGRANSQRGSTRGAQKKHTKNKGESVGCRLFLRGIAFFWPIL